METNWEPELGAKRHGKDAGKDEGEHYKELIVARKAAVPAIESAPHKDAALPSSCS